MSKIVPKDPKRGAECPDCGSIKTYVRNTGHDEDGRVIRRRICLQCDKIFGTVEIVLPEEFSFTLTDTYRENRTKHTARRSQDRIFIGTVKIIPGKRSNWCKRGTHKLTGKNLRLDSKRNRHCRACENETARIRRLVNRDFINQRERERYHRNRRRLGAYDRTNNAFTSVSRRTSS